MEALRREIFPAGTFQRLPPAGRELLLGFGQSVRLAPAVFRDTGFYRCRRKTGLTLPGTASAAADLWNFECIRMCIFRRTGFLISPGKIESSGTSVVEPHCRI